MPLAVLDRAGRNARLQPAPKPASREDPGPDRGREDGRAMSEQAGGVETMNGSPAATSAAVARLQRSDGAAEVGFVHRHGETRLSHLFQSDPCRVMFPWPDAGDVPQAVLVTTSGGLTDGDRVRVAVRCGEGAAAVVTGQAAEKIYRAAGTAACRIDVGIDVKDGGCLEWLPQETIVFDGARLARRVEARLDGQAQLLACEMLVLGRSASGERFTHGAIHDSWRLRRDGRLVWADALQLNGPPPRAAGFGEATASAFALYSGPDAAAQLDRSRALLAEMDTPRSGTTLVNGILLARFLGQAKDVRRSLVGWLAALRAAALGRPAQLPRLWHV